MQILVVDDEARLRAAVTRALELVGYQVEAVADGEAALRILRDREPDALVLDLGLPGIGGLDVCRRLRELGSAVPVLMLTARDAVPDRVRGLDAGADDYLVKPFALAELLARIRALLRRRDPAGEPTLTYADVVLDLEVLRGWRGARMFDVTPTEARLLECFLRQPERILGRSRIYRAVWGYDFGHSSNCLEVYVRYLRRKLEAGGEPRLIHTVRNAGYVLRTS